MTDEGAARGQLLNREACTSTSGALRPTSIAEQRGRIGIFRWIRRGLVVRQGNKKTCGIYIEKLCISYEGSMYFSINFYGNYIERLCIIT